MIHPTAIIYPNVLIGNNVYIGAYTVIGAPPEHKDYMGKPGAGVVIGDDAYITSHVTIDSGTTRPTTINNNVKIFQHSHIGHDAFIEQDVIMANAIIGGHAHIMKGANLGLGCAIHQWKVIGSYCIVGMNAAVIKGTNARPGLKIAGCPASDVGDNTIGIARANVSNQQLLQELVRYEQICVINQP